MPELEEIWRACLAGGCPTHIQGGADGMLQHLKVIHHSDLSIDQVEEIYSDKLGPEIGAQR